MTRELQVKCINKANRFDPFSRITHIGGNEGGTPWRITEDEAIRYIEARQYDFYVLVFFKKVYLIVERHNGRKYLKTQADDFLGNNLLALDECPIS